MLVHRLIFSKHLEEGEDVQYAIHRHWIVIVKPVLEIAFFGIVIPWGLYFLGFNSDFFFWGIVVWSAVAYLRFILLLIDWYSNAWLITDMSLIVIEFTGFFSNTAGRSAYEDIEGISYEIKGFWGTVFGFGDLTVKLASGNVNVMPVCDSPRQAELAIAKYQDRYLHDREMKNSAHLKDVLADMVSHYMKQKLK